jgi:hypothetical protein
MIATSDAPLVDSAQKGFGSILWLQLLCGGAGGGCGLCDV